MCAIMKEMITEEKIEMAKEEIEYGELSLSQIARVYKLSLAIVQELA